MNMSLSTIIEIKKNPATYISKQAELVQIDNSNKVILKDGNRQVIDKKIHN